MRFVYVDEAGTSAREPVLVVAGIMVDADKDYFAVASTLKGILDARVPKRMREGYIFHAKDVFGGGRNDKESWSLFERMRLIKAVLAIPRRMKLPVCYGICRKALIVEDLGRNFPKHGIHHVLAFQHCIERADSYMRQYTPSNEVINIVSEDVPEMKRWLKISLSNFGKNPIPFEGLSSDGQIARSHIHIEDRRYLELNRVIDTVHFAAKADAPLLQIADACAFTLHRYFAEQRYGAELLYALFKKQFNPELWKGNLSGGIRSFHYPRPYHNCDFSFSPKFCFGWTAPTLW